MNVALDCLIAGWVAVAGICIFVWVLVRVRPDGRPQCPKCVYDLRGVVQFDRPIAFPVVCSECGYRIRKKRHLLIYPRRWRWVLLGSVLFLASGIYAPHHLYTVRNFWRISPTWLVVYSVPYMNRDALEGEFRKRILAQEWEVRISPGSFVSAERTVLSETGNKYRELLASRILDYLEDHPANAEGVFYFELLALTGDDSERAVDMFGIGSLGRIVQEQFSSIESLANFNLPSSQIQPLLIAALDTMTPAGTQPMPDWHARTGLPDYGAIAFRTLVDKLASFGPVDGSSAEALIRFLERINSTGESPSPANEAAFLRTLLRVEADPDRVIPQLQMRLNRVPRGPEWDEEGSIECVILLDLLRGVVPSESAAVMKCYERFDSAPARARRNRRLGECVTLDETAVRSIFEDLQAADELVQLSAADCLFSHELHFNESMLVLHEMMDSNSFESVCQAVLILIEHGLPLEGTIPALSRKNFSNFDEVQRLQSGSLMNWIETGKW